MERFYVAFQSLPGDTIITGGNSGGRGFELPRSRHIFNVKVIATTDLCGETHGEVIDLALVLTPRQVAQIVWHFFSDITVRNGFPMKFLQRLMEKRWAFMTSPMYKHESASLIDQEGYDDIRYHRDMWAMRPPKQAA